jgi:hypothetical protein
MLNPKKSQSPTFFGSRGFVIMAILVVEFSSGGYKIRKISA